MSSPGDLPAGEFDLAAWLASLDLGQYAGTFAENEITREILPELTDEDLRSCGVAVLGHRKKLLKAIAALPAKAPEPPKAQTTESDRGSAEEAPAPVTFDPHRKSKFILPEDLQPLPKAPATRSPMSTNPTSSGTTSTAPLAPPTPLPTPRRRTGLLGRLLVGKFLVVSIVAHLLFGVGAAYYVVQQIQAKRKVTFQGGPPLVDPSTHALEHRISVGKKQKSGGAPAQARRVVTAGLASIALPDLPIIPNTTTAVPNMMAGLGGAGFGTGLGVGGGAGSGMGGSVGAGLGTGMKALSPTMACRCSIHERLSKLNQNGGKPEVEIAVTRSLDWLKTQQNADGTWGRNYKAGMTGLVLLCYLGRCATPDDPQYGEVVTKGITALLEIAKRGGDGLISTNGPTQQAIYEHGIATYALGEMLALAPITKKELPGLKEAFAAGVDFIIAKQRPDGGWRYLTSTETQVSDLSVTGWQFQALKAAKLYDVKVEGLNGAITRAVDYIKSRQNVKPQPDGGTLGGIGNLNKSASYNQWAMTGVGVLILQTLGKGSNSFNIENGLDFASKEFRKNPPNWDTNCDLYAWYYYSQAFFQEGAKEWRVWNTTAMSQVLANQTPEGNWKPEGTALHHSPGTSAGGDQEIYRTCLCTLILEVYYRYLRVN